VNHTVCTMFAVSGKLFGEIATAEMAPTMLIVPGSFILVRFYKSYRD